jgi:MftR C-terminal domain
MDSRRVPDVAGVGSPYAASASTQISGDGWVAFATVSFDERGHRVPTARLAERPQLREAMAMMDSSTTLRAYEMASRARVAEAVTALLRERTGVDGSDVGPRLMAACFLAGASIAIRAWIRAGARDDLDARIDEVMGVLAEGFEAPG